MSKSLAAAPRRSPAARVEMGFSRFRGFMGPPGCDWEDAGVADGGDVGGYFYLDNICYYNGLQADCQSFFAILHIKRPQVYFSTWGQRFQLTVSGIPMSSAIRVIKSFIVGAALLSNSIFRISGSSSFAIAIRSGLVLMICTFGFMRNWI